MNKLISCISFKFSLLMLLISLLTACGGGGDSAVATDDTVNDINTKPATFNQTSANIDTGDTYSSSEISVDASGDSIIRTNLAILFRSTATKAQVDELLVRINAVITASVAGSRSVSIRIPDPVTVANLEVVIADIANESFVEAVLKSVVMSPSALPDNVTESSEADYKIIDNHLAVGGAAAWNARAAIVKDPTIIFWDWFGFGETQLATYLDASLSGAILNGSSNPSDHGYHVAGIAAGSYDGDTSPAGLVTGMFPGHSSVYIYDLSAPRSPFDTQVAFVQAAAALNTGNRIMSTSLGRPCQKTTTSGTCRELKPAMQEAIMWADMVRAADLEDHIFHVTAAGNRQLPGYDMRDTQTHHPFSTAATMTNMVDADGLDVSVLTNTMAVENLVGTGSYPRKILCLSENSFIGGSISAIGTDVISLTSTGTAVMSGTSMATPQVAGLAAYLLAIDPDLTPQSIKNILLVTSQAVPMSSGCSDWDSPAPAIDAYAAVLALDDASALTGNRNDASVRNAILDISNDGAKLGTNGQFDENDLIYYMDEIDTGTQAIKDKTETVKYSRADLNGDGYDGGLDGYKRKFNLDIDFPPTYTAITASIESQDVKFNESALTDNDILCYYAYSSLYTGDTSIRKTLMADRCRASNLAVYYTHLSIINFPGFSATCSADSVQQYINENNTENVPLLTEITPVADYWLGTSSVISHFLEDSPIRGFDNSGCTNATLYAKAALNTTLQNTVDTDRLDIDIVADVSAECVGAIGPNTNVCSDSRSGTQWIARYDLEISEPATYQLEVSLDCSRVLPTDFPVSTSSLTAVVTRFQPDGTVILSNQDYKKFVFPISESCDSDNPVIRIDQPMEFDAADGSPDKKDRVTVMIIGGQEAIVNKGSTTDTGIVNDTSTMKGFISVKNINRI